MANIKYNIPNEELVRITNAFVNLFPKSEGYDDKEWTDEVIRRFIVDNVYKYELKCAIDEARSGITKPDDIIEAE